MASSPEANIYSTRSFARASSRVCHCMLSGESGPPCFSAWMWSITSPGHGPIVTPVAGQGLLLRKVRLAEVLLPILLRQPEWWPEVGNLAPQAPHEALVCDFSREPLLCKGLTDPQILGAVPG